MSAVCVTEGGGLRLWAAAEGRKGGREGNLREDPAANREGHGEDEQHEQCHLRHEEEEDLVVDVQQVGHDDGSHLEAVAGCPAAARLTSV